MSALLKAKPDTAVSFGRHNVDKGHKVSFKAGSFLGVGKVVTTGADGCTVADKSGREHQVHWHEVTLNHSEPDGDEGKAGNGDGDGDEKPLKKAGAGVPVLFLKARVSGYTTSKGTYVAEHEDSRKAAGYVAPKEGEVGHEEHKNYGVYFRPGDKVRDQYGKEHLVMHHRGPVVTTYSHGGKKFHPAKLTLKPPAMDDRIASMPRGGTIHVGESDGVKTHIERSGDGKTVRHVRTTSSGSEVFKTEPFSRYNASKNA